VIGIFNHRVTSMPRLAFEGLELCEAMNISYGALTYKADNELPPEWREPQLEDRSRPIITACESGELAALAGKLLKDMGFSNVSILEGGTQAWKEAGFPTQ